MTTLTQRLTDKFRRDETGSIAVEAMLIFPLLTWAYLATFVYFDAFRAQSTTLKATYTVADALSRETDPFTPAYLNSLWRLQKFLTSSNHDPRLRITQVTYKASTNAYSVVWSQSRGGVVPMTTATLQNFVNQIPVMPDGEKVVITESWVVYEPIFTIGLDAFVFDNLIVTRPRFASHLCWSTVNSGFTAANLTC